MIGCSASITYVSNDSTHEEKITVPRDVQGAFAPLIA